MVEGVFGDRMGDAEVNIPLLKPLKPLWMPDAGI